jgi:hypothetical protein
MLSILATLLWTKNICHHLSNSCSQANFIILSENLFMIVSISCLPFGGVFRIEICLILDNAIFKLLGIGVADIAIESMFDLNSFIFSLSATQNLCSSSVIINHKFLYITLSESNL